jgi:hypothetical protein
VLRHDDDAKIPPRNWFFDRQMNKNYASNLKHSSYAVTKIVNNGVASLSLRLCLCNYGEVIPHPTVEGTIGRNEMDTHADTCCAGANWKLLDSTNKVCKVTPFLDSYEPVKEVMVARCGTVWTSPDTGHEYLLVGDQMLWFRSQMDHSPIYPNQIREYGLPVYNDPFSKQQFGIDGNEAFIPFNTTGTIVYFETRVPMDWETRNLPIIMLTGEEWDPVNVGLGTGQSREQAEMRMIRSLESGVPKRKMAAFKQRELDS